jgi:hypothetical protein
MEKNEFEVLNLFEKICSRNQAAWQRHLSSLHTTEFWHGLPLVITMDEYL